MVNTSWSKGPRPFPVKFQDTVPYSLITFLLSVPFLVPGSVFFGPVQCSFPVPEPCSMFPDRFATPCSLSHSWFRIHWSSAVLVSCSWSWFHVPWTLCYSLFSFSFLVLCSLALCSARSLFLNPVPCSLITLQFSVPFPVHVIVCIGPVLCSVPFPNMFLDTVSCDVPWLTWYSSHIAIWLWLMYSGGWMTRNWQEIGDHNWTMKITFTRRNGEKVPWTPRESLEQVSSSWGSNHGGKGQGLPWDPFSFLPFIVANTFSFCSQYFSIFGGPYILFFIIVV